MPRQDTPSTPPSESDEPAPEQPDPDPDPVHMEPEPMPMQPEPMPMQPEPMPMQPEPMPVQPDPTPMRSDACRDSEALQIAALGHALDASEASTPEPGSVDAGRIAFNSRQPGGLVGNGRACSDCHSNSGSFQLTPATAAARFTALQACRVDEPSWDDPLFRAVDADDFRQNGDAAQDFKNLTENGLVRVTLPLPPNIRLIDPATDQPSDQTEAEVFRAVPTIFDVALTGPDGRNPSPRGPNPAGGYQLDARVASLDEQATAALRSHSGITAELPSTLIDAISAFERSEFSSARVRELSEALNAEASELPDSTLPLDELALAGKAVFERACATCHGGPTHTSNEPPADRYSNVVSACPRPVDSQSPPRWSFKECPESLTRNVRRYEITREGGQIERRDSDDPGRALLTGAVAGNPPADDWAALDVPPLFAIRNTAPYFHNNSAASLDEVLDHYTAFFEYLEATVPIEVSGKVVSTDGQNFDRKFTPAERPALRAFLDQL